MTQDSLGRNLRMLRADRGITLAEAEELTGVTQETLSALERGQRGAYTSTLRKIADAYDITLGDLLGGELALVPAGKAAVPETPGRPAVPEPYLRVPHGPGGEAEARREVIRLLEEARDRGELDLDDTLIAFLDDAVEVRHISDAEKDPVYGSWVTFARRFSERWQRKIAEGTFDRGEYNEFIANLEDFDPILVELGLREKQERPYNPHTTFGPVVEFAITRITALFNPMIRAVTEKFEEDELAPLRRQRAELERLESGTRRVANG
jgi:transcriptional regulator with XRE-family HTH domain